MLSGGRDLRVQQRRALDAILRGSDPACVSSVSPRVPSSLVLLVLDAPMQRMLQMRHLPHLAEYGVALCMTPKEFEDLAAFTEKIAAAASAAPSPLVQMASQLRVVFLVKNAQLMPALVQKALLAPFYGGVSVVYAGCAHQHELMALAQAVSKAYVLPRSVAGSERGKAHSQARHKATSRLPGAVLLNRHGHATAGQVQHAQQFRAHSAIREDLPDSADGRASRYVSMVADACIDFVPVQRNMISLEIPDCFPALYDYASSSTRWPNSVPTQTVLEQSAEKRSFLPQREKQHEQRLLAKVDMVSDALLSVLVQAESCPILVANRHGPSALVAATVHSKLRSIMNRATQGSGPDKLASSGTSGTAWPRSHLPLSKLHSPSWQTSRTLLYICDRTVDLVPCLLHPWSYERMCFDILDADHVSMQLRVASGEKDTHVPDEQQKQCYTLDQEDDSLWEAMRSLEFPQLAEEIQTLVSKYKQDASEVASNVSRALGAMDDLRRRKELLDMHTLVATALLEAIKARGLDEFVEIESRIRASEATSARSKNSRAMGSAFNVNPIPRVEELVQIAISVPRSNHLEMDLARLFGVYVLSLREHVTDSELAMLVGALKEKASVDAQLLDMFVSLANMGVRPPCAMGRSEELASQKSATNRVPGSKRERMRKLLGGAAARGMAGLSQVAAKMQEFITLSDQSPLILSRLLTRVSDLVGHAVAAGESGEAFPPLEYRSLVSDTERQNDGSNARARDTLSTSERVAMHALESTFWDPTHEHALSFDDLRYVQGVQPYAMDVLMVGGGSLMEWAELMRMPKTDRSGSRGDVAFKRDITYICTDLVSPDRFLGQLFTAIYGASHKRLHTNEAV